MANVTSPPTVRTFNIELSGTEAQALKDVLDYYYRRHNRVYGFFAAGPVHDALLDLDNQLEELL